MDDCMDGAMVRCWRVCRAAHDDDGGEDEGADAGPDEGEGPWGGAGPLAEPHAPERGADHDRGHVQRPAREPARHRGGTLLAWRAGCGIEREKIMMEAVIARRPNPRT